MRSWIRLNSFLLTAALVVVVSAFQTVPAHADDGAPPPPVETSVESPPSEGSTTDGTSPSETTTETTTESVPAEQGNEEGTVVDSETSPPAPTEEAVPEIPPQEERASEVSIPIGEQTVTDELLAQLPEGTEVVVLNAEGEALPLATEEAAEAIAFIDPVWCPVGVSPQNGTGGCTTSYGNLKLLIDNLMAGTAGVVPGANGVIWIAGEPDLSLGPIILNGTDPDLGTMETFSLTLKGAWDNTFFSTVTNPATPSTFAQTILITNWQGDITLSDITIDATGTGLTVITTKNITLTRVGASGNTASGAYLDNTSGTGNVTVNSSKFNSNGVTGLTVVSNGTITLSNLQVNGNTGGYGAYIANNAAALPKNVTMTGANEFNNNRDIGLQISSIGAITLNDVTASENGISDFSGFGAYLDNCAEDISGDCTALTKPPVTLTGTNVFAHNYNGGLQIISNGPININNLIASSNVTQYGAYLYNVGASAAQPVILTGASQFKFNGGDGLFIFSRGAVTLNNITANDNGESGAVIDNTSGTAAVMLNGVNTFRDNDKWGLKISSRGAVTVSNVTAYMNGSDAGSQEGVLLDNSTSVGLQPVTLSGFNSFTYNIDGGLKINSNGAITLSNVTASYNTNSAAILGGGKGVELDNTASTQATPKPVTISGTNVFSSNYDYGLSIVTYGAVLLNNVTAESNGYGPLVKVGGVYILNNVASAAMPAAVTITGTNKFNLNANNGLTVKSIGAITLSNATAESNGSGFYGVSGVGTGVWLENFAGTNAGVTLSGTNSFNSNWSTGLYVWSSGAITLNSVTAGYNGIAAAGGVGAFLNNAGAGAGSARKVTLTGLNAFNGNYLHGLHVLATGLVSVNSVTASSNGNGDPSFTGHGVLIDNTSSGNASPQGVTFTGTSNFTSNDSAGLEIKSFGAVSLSNLSARYNGYYDPTRREGVYIDNATGAVTAAAVTLSGTNFFENNKSTGLKVLSLGAITLNNVNAAGNNSGVIADGVNLNNLGSPTAAGVTLTGTNNFSSNYSNGLVVDSKGPVLASNISASGNANGMGADIDNSTAGTPKSVTLSGVNSFQYNYLSGIEIKSKGAVSVNSITAYNNGMLGGFSAGAGLTIDNCVDPGSGCTGAGNVTLSGTNSLNNNYYNGLYVESNGTITLNNVTASNNGVAAGNTGASLYNNGAAATQNVALTGTNVFNNNGLGGLLIGSKGTITLNNLTAGSNLTAWGALLDNTASDTGAGVTLTGTNVFSYNNSTGLIINSDGAISASNVTASYSDLGMGAEIYNSAADTPKSVTFSGTNVFSNNYLSGLSIVSKGAVSVNGLTAFYNGMTGSLDGYGLKIDNNDFGAAGNVTLSGTNSLTYNYFDGLRVESNGAITLSNVTASNNGTPTGYYGVTLNNSTASPAQNVTLTGVNRFESNKSGGLIVVSLGAITLSNVTAINNGVGVDADGVNLDNLASTTGAGVTLSGTNVFSNNTGGGLWVRSKGAVSANNVTASYNAGGSGAYIENSSAGSPKNVTLSGVNVFNNNYIDGIIIFSRGAVSVNSVTAYYNGRTGSGVGHGLYIDNNDPLAVGNVTVSGTSSLTENYYNGLKVFSNGVISLNNVTASYNGVLSGYGAELDNYNPVTAAAPKNVILTGANVFNYNESGGLKVISFGAVTSSLSLTATNNNGIDGGIKLDNSGAFTAQPVTLSGSVTVSSNNGPGLTVLSAGAITINKLTASFNGNPLGGGGAKLDNTAGSIASAVTLTGVNAITNNYGHGLEIDATGAISVSNLTSNNNGTAAWPGSGADLNNTYLNTGGVTFSGVNKFQGNFTSGLVVVTSGAISLSSVNASSNSNGYGVWLSNSHSTQPGVTLSGANTFEGNKLTGLSIASYGAVTLNNITAANNGMGPSSGDGASITNSGGTLAKNVTLTGINTFRSNDNGLVVTSRGSISVSSLTAAGNSLEGARLDNCADPGTGCTGTGSVALSGFGTFSNNSTNGLIIISRGAVTLANITARDNNIGNGVVIDNSPAAAPQAVTITGINTFFGNGGDGLAVYSIGAITLNSVTANENSANGVYLLNYYSGTSGVTLNGVNTFLDNGSTGLFIWSNGNVSVAKATADGNINGGMYANTLGNVTLTCGNFTNDGPYGVRVAGGTVGVSMWKLIGVFASGSTANIDTSFWTVWPGAISTVRNCP